MEFKKGIQWTLACGCTILCGCRHFIGQEVYCPKGHKWTQIVSWKEVNNGS